MAISVKVMPANHHIWDYLGKFDHDRTRRSPEPWFITVSNEGKSSPFMALINSGYSDFFSFTQIYNYY